MKQWSLLILLLMITLSGYAKKDKYYLTIDSRLETYLSEFAYEAYHQNMRIKKKHIKNINMIIVGDIPYDHTYGMWFKDSHTIMLDSKIMNMDEIVIKATLWHELGHALFQFEHVCDYKHIMNPLWLLGDDVYFDLYWEELKISFFDRATHTTCKDEQYIPISILEIEENVGEDLPEMVKPIVLPEIDNHLLELVTPP